MPTDAQKETGNRGGVLPGTLERANSRLYPPYSGGRYQILTLLRKHLLKIAAEELPKRGELVLVDFGCGDMPYRSLFTPYVARYCGADLPENAGAEYRIGPDNKIGVPDEFADVVLSNQVLEHVENPRVYLAECRRILKPDGVLVLSTHGYWMYHPNPRDLWRWTGDGLRTVIGEAGFEITQFEGLMGLAATGFQLLQDAVMPKVPGFTRPLLAAGIQPLIAMADHLNSPAEKRRDACVFIALAQKKP